MGIRIEEGYGSPSPPQKKEKKMTNIAFTGSTLFVSTLKPQPLSSRSVVITTRSRKRDDETSPEMREWNGINTCKQGSLFVSSVYQWSTYNPFPSII